MDGWGFAFIIDKYVLTCVNTNSFAACDSSTTITTVFN